MANQTARFNLPDWIDHLSIEYAVKLMLFGFYGGTAPTGGTGIPSTTQPKQYSTSSSSAILTADGTVFTLAAGEAGSIQNQLTEPLYVKRGASCSATDFTYVLKACTAAKDGLGGTWYIDDWIGPISVCKSNATASYTATKLS